MLKVGSDNQYRWTQDIMLHFWTYAKCWWHTGFLIIVLCCGGVLSLCMFVLRWCHPVCLMGGHSVTDCSAYAALLTSVYTHTIWLQCIQSDWLQCIHSLTDCSAYAVWLTSVHTQSDWLQCIQSNLLQCIHSLTKDSAYTVWLMTVHTLSDWRQCIQSNWRQCIHSPTDCNVYTI